MAARKKQKILSDTAKWSNETGVSSLKKNELKKNNATTQKRYTMHKQNTIATHEKVVNAARQKAALEQRTRKKVFLLIKNVLSEKMKQQTTDTGHAEKNSTAQHTNTIESEANADLPQQKENALVNGSAQSHQRGTCDDPVWIEDDESDGDGGSIDGANGEEKIITIADKIEHELHNFRDYNTKSRDIMYHLKNNSFITHRLLSGDLQPFTLLRMSKEELATDKLKEERQRLEQETELLRGVADAGVVDDEIKCPACSRLGARVFITGNNEGHKAESWGSKDVETQKSCYCVHCNYHFLKLYV